jgi:hypothetical protein
LEWISKNLQTKAIFTTDLRGALVRDGVQLSQSQIMDTLREREWAQRGICHVFPLEDMRIRAEARSDRLWI